MAANASPAPSRPASSSLPNPRFTLELEFVLCLSNPYYLSHLALNYPQLLNPSKDPKPSSTSSESAAESDASKFASYLSYLYKYWRKPEYARFLSHPGATLRNLELLQQEQFRKDVIRPDVIEKLLAVGSDDHDSADGEGRQRIENEANEGDKHMTVEGDDGQAGGGQNMDIRVG